MKKAVSFGRFSDEVDLPKVGCAGRVEGMETLTLPLTENVPSPESVPGGPFRKGADPRRHDPNKPKALAVELPLPDDGASQQLQDMRHVYLNAKRFDKTEGQANQRKFKDKHARQFQEVFARLEKELRDQKRAEALAASSGESVQAVVDLGASKCLELAERVLKELSGGG